MERAIEAISFEEVQGEISLFQHNCLLPNQTEVSLNIYVCKSKGQFERVVVEINLQLKIDFTHFSAAYKYQLLYSDFDRLSLSKNIDIDKKQQFKMENRGQSNKKKNLF